MHKLFIKQVFLALFLFPILSYAQELPERPKPPMLVNDFAGLLSPSEAQALEQKLVQFDRQTSTQLAIVILKNLYGYEISDLAFQLGEKWGIGQKKFDNGALILVKPKTGNARGRVFIATGYGLEGTVPDAVANRIVEHEIIPRFKQNKYYQGLDKATSTLMELTRGEYTAQEYYQATKEGGGIPLFAIIFILFAIFSIFGGRRKARHSSMGHGLPFWVLLTMLGSSSRSQAGSFGHFSSGSGGGGFGGFGGGSFGGGGAGGSW